LPKKVRRQSLSPPEDPSDTSLSSQQPPTSFFSSPKNTTVQKNSSNRVASAVSDCERISSEPNVTGSKSETGSSNPNTDRPTNNNVSSLNSRSFSAIQPSRDWSEEFPAPRSLEECDKYYSKFLLYFCFLPLRALGWNDLLLLTVELFQEEYPKYLTYFNYLTKVAKEFSELEKKLHQAEPRSAERHEVNHSFLADYISESYKHSFLVGR
uniref:DH domain-containing protein n=1 Tax=Gongylonema pulchrum TaxID=637853 RepID=A0A183D707_9BILA